eukprot:m.33554 g.33554  ORF g.33554 m.33554 type:complete len:85 (-) comp9636_c0_seq3:764-1018(-)
MLIEIIISQRKARITCEQGDCSLVEAVKEHAGGGSIVDLQHYVWWLNMRYFAAGTSVLQVGTVDLSRQTVSVAAGSSARNAATS